MSTINTESLNALRQIREIAATHDATAATLEWIVDICVAVLDRERLRNERLRGVCVHTMEK